MKLFKNIKHRIKWNIITPVCHILGIVAPTDWIDAYYHMSKAILPYLKQFKKNEKMGIPANIYNENYKQEMLDLGYTFDDNTFTWHGTVNGIKADDYLSSKWDKIIDEIIFALEYTVNNEPTEDCEVPNLKYNPNQKEVLAHTVPDENGYLKLEFNEDYGKMRIDMDLLKAKQERVRNGFKLMGEYWQSIWD